MTQTFTDENFTGYEFRCSSINANVGYKDTCEVYKDNELIPACTSTVTWGNRRWESFTFATVLSESKQYLQDLLDGVQKPIIDTDFLETLVEHGIISDYGEFDNGETVILMDSWEQVEGEDEREYNEETGRMEKTGKFIKSPYAKLHDLAEKGLLKPDYNSTILNTGYVFTDEYDKCYECGRVYNMDYGELTYIEDTCELLCDSCINSHDNVQALIDTAREDYRNALRPTIDQSIIEDLGYSLVTEETFSFEREFWGAKYMTIDYAKDFIEKYNGFIQIYEVAQFVQPFQIWVHKSDLKKAKAKIKRDFNVD